MKQQLKQNQNQSNTIQTQSFDENNRPAEVDELDFDRDEPAGQIGEPLSEGELAQSELARYQSAEHVREAGLTSGAMPGEDPTDDDLSPETLIREDGARSPREPGSDVPAEWDLTQKNEIGGGHGLDEAELARRDPLDKQPWDGDPDEPLQSMPSVNEEALTGESDAELDQDLDMDQDRP